MPHVSGRPDPTVYDICVVLLSRWRWWVGLAMAGLSVATVGLAVHPSTYAATATVVLTPSSYATRVHVMLEWRMAEVPALRDVALTIERKDTLARLTVAAASVQAARAGLEALLSWINQERRAPTVAEREMWQQELAAIERRLPTLSPSAASYWSQRAIELHRQLVDGAIAERLEVVSRSPVTPVAQRWAITLVAGGLSGVVVGVVLILVMEWVRREREARAAAG